MKIYSLFILLFFFYKSYSQSDTIHRENIFDRKEHIIDTMLSVPEVERYEKQLNITNGRYIQINSSTRVWVEEEGEGPALLLISGGPGASHHTFHPHFTAASEFARIIYFDLRGTGLSGYISGKDGYKVEQAVNDIEALRKKLKIKRWHILGLSFGGALAQLYMIKFPKSVSGVVLVGSAVPMSIDVGVYSRQQQFMSEVEKKRVRQIYSLDGGKTTVSPVHNDLISRETQKKMLYNAFLNGDWKRRHFYRMSETEIAIYATYDFVQDKNYYAQMMTSYESLDLKDCFMQCPIPVLIVEGKWDLAYGSDKTRLFSAQFPTARLQIYENAGHVPFRDEPIDFFEKLKFFMRNTNKPVQGIGEWRKKMAFKKIYK